MDRKLKSKRTRWNLKNLNRRKLPRLSIFRSNRGCYLQLIDDGRGCTLIGLRDSKDKKQGKTKLERASDLGEKMATETLKLGIREVIFDKSWYRFHGVVKGAFSSFQKIISESK